MIDKKIFKYFLITFIALLSLVFILLFMRGGNDSHSVANFYTLPFGEINLEKYSFFFLLALISPIIAIFLGYLLAYIVVILFCKVSKLSKRIEFIGYAAIDRTPKYLRKRYIIQLIFAVLLSLNIWIILVNNESIMQFWLNDSGLDSMEGSEGQYYNFVFIPWYWLPAFLTSLVFSMCIVIMDSGLVLVRQLRGQKDFSDTERVGDKMFSIVKGYAGISVILGFIELIQSPRGNEASLVLYPMLAFLFILPAILGIDAFRGFGIKLIFKAVKPYYLPQLIKLNFEKTEITKYQDLLKQEQ